MVSRDIKHSGQFSLLSTVYEIIYLINHGVCFLTEFKPLILTLHCIDLDIKTPLDDFNLGFTLGMKARFANCSAWDGNAERSIPGRKRKKKIVILTKIKVLKNELIIKAVNSSSLVANKFNCWSNDLQANRLKQ